jgi:HK97 family phage portal protein
MTLTPKIRTNLTGQNSFFRGGKTAMPDTSFERGEGITQAAMFEQGGFFDVLSSGESSSGVGAWRLGVVYRCVAVISETIAALNFTLIERTKDGSSFLAEKYKGFNLYATDPNKHITWFEFFSSLMAEALTEGNGYALIIRNSEGYVKELRILSRGECSPYVEKFIDTSVRITYSVGGKMYSENDVIHIKSLGSDGYVGESVLTLARKSVQGGLSQQEFNYNMFKNGLNLQGTLEAPATLSETAMKHLKEAMKDFKGAKNSSGTMILEEGLKYNRMSVNPIDAQFIENRRFTVEDICRFYGVPLHKAMNLDRATNNNIEHQDLEFYKSCIMPWVVRTEQHFDKKILTDFERRKYSHRFDITELLRADAKGRAELYNSLFAKGAITPNEIRRRENMNPTGEDVSNKTYMQLAMSEVSKLDQNRRGIKNKNKDEKDTNGDAN